MTDSELPDFNDMQAQADLIYSLSIEKANLDLTIKIMQADITRKVTTDTAYWVGGKAPSVAYIDATYTVTGLESELTPLKQKLIVSTAELDKAKFSLDLMKTKIDVWRSKMASERVAVTS
jgi:hypothetical protein